MNNAKVANWLKKRNIELEENFADALRRMAQEYKVQHKLRTLDEVYSLIGVTKQNIYYWGKNPCGIQTKKTSNDTL